MTYQGIIFDFNGVLLWDETIQRSAWNHMAQSLRGRVFSHAEMALHVDGRPNRHTLEYLLERPLNDAETDRLSEEKETIYRQMCLDLGAGFHLSPGAQEALDWLAGRGIPRTIATSSGAGNVAFFFTHLSLNRWFSRQQTVYHDGSFAGKPAPDIFLHAAQRLDLPPGQCVIVEDSQSGLKAAQAAGAGLVVGLGEAARSAAAGAAGLWIASLADLPLETLF